jgi:hypothetical protein
VFPTIHLLGAVINHRYNVYADLISRASDLICRRSIAHHVSLTSGAMPSNFICDYNGLMSLQSDFDSGQMLQSKMVEGVAACKFAITIAFDIEG